MTYIAHHVTTTYASPKPPFHGGSRELGSKQNGSTDFTITDLTKIPELKSLITKVIHKKEFDQLLEREKARASEEARPSKARVVTSKARPRLLMNAQNNESHASISMSSTAGLTSFKSKLTSQELNREINAQVTKALHRLITRGIVIISPESQDKFTLPGLHNLGKFLESLFLNNSTGSSNTGNGNSQLIKLDTIMSRLKRDELWRWIHEDKVSEILDGMVQAGYICKMFDGLDWKWGLKK